MTDYIIERVIREGRYITETGCTVRACATHFGVSKSTVHKDVTERLYYVDMTIFRSVQKVLGINLSERHLRGGNATRLKYEKRRHSTENFGNCSKKR